MTDTQFTDQSQTTIVAACPGVHFAWPCSMVLLPMGKLQCSI